MHIGLIVGIGPAATDYLLSFSLNRISPAGLLWIL